MKTEKTVKHTQRPKWRRANDGGDIVEIMDDYGSIIGTSIDMEQAQLWIAAADLLEAAKQVLEMLLACGYGGSNSGVESKHEMMLKAAILKAEGGK